MTRRSTRIVTIALAAAAIASPAGASQNIGSPDARDLNAQASSAKVGQDLRSPDTRDLSERPGMFSQAPRWPYAASPSPSVPVDVAAPAPVVRRVDAGFDWADAGIGAAALFALVLLAMAGAAITRRDSPAMG